MPLTIQQRLDRLAIRVTELTYWTDRSYVDLPDWTFDGMPLRLGQAWPDQEEVVTLAHGQIEVPDDWPLETTRLVLDLGGEALVCIRYGPGSEEDFGHDPWHRRYPLRARSFSLEARAVARLPFGVPSRAAALTVARVVLVDEAVERLRLQIRLIAEEARALGDHPATGPLVDIAESALSSLRWPSATHTYVSRMAGSSQMQAIWSLPERLDPHPPGLTDEEHETVAAACNWIEGELRRLARRYPREGSILLSGHAHIDVAWLWPLDETRRKAQRTFHTVMSLIDRHPEFRFNQSSAQLYEFIREDDPDLFDRIQGAVASGQWEPIGGMWLEPDVNMTAGESLVRQLLYGQRYFERHFGRRSAVCWLPDCFGFNPNLPQLLEAAGIGSFFTTKLTWSETNRFPWDLFWWEGLDGTRVLAHMFNNPENIEAGTAGYNGDPGPYAILNTWRNYGAKNRFPETLLSIGYGDGGGGVTPEMLEEVRELRSFPAVPTLRFGRVEEFYREALDTVRGTDLPHWNGELYLELHRGTLTTQGRTKYLHRRAERDLVAAEALAAMNALMGGDLPRSLEEQWRVVLRNEFHDILPGSSIRQVYETAEAELSGVIEAARGVMERELEVMAERIGSGRGPGGRGGVEDASTSVEGRDRLLVVNPDLSARPLRVEMERDFAGAQQVDGGYCLTGSQDVPALGGIVVLDPDAPSEAAAAQDLLENRFLRVTLAPDGTLASVWDKAAQREVLAGRGNQVWAYVDKPRSWDAWDIDPEYPTAGEEILASGPAEVIERGPHRVSVRVERRFRSSTIVQEIRLWANSARLELKTTLDWHDRRWLLKARFPLAVRSDTATFETAFGVVRRPTHRNTSWDAARFEVAAHRFVDLSEPGYGVALLNDGKYGHDVVGSEVGISLLRSPVYPDPLADEGIQTFTYALYPHAGDWSESGLLMEAEDLNRPLLVRPCRAERAGTWQAPRLKGMPLGLGALKVLEDGEGLVFRVYEPSGRRGSCRLELPEGWRAEADSNLLEEPQGEPTLDFGPFQVRSWILRR